MASQFGLLHYGFTGIAKFCNFMGSFYFTLGVDITLMLPCSALDVDPKLHPPFLL